MTEKVHTGDCVYIGSDPATESHEASDVYMLHHKGITMPVRFSEHETQGLIAVTVMSHYHCQRYVTPQLQTALKAKYSMSIPIQP